MAQQVKITETVLRDSHQSLIATRMTTEEMLPILEKLDAVGYHSLEAWGGATFDACLRFLNEDPWDRLRKIRDKVKNTKLQMLFRGQNILGYRHYSDDVVEYFVQKSIANGVDILRIFDALNDPRNLRTAINATLKEGGHVQAAISYTTGPVYTTEYYTSYAKTLEEMGASSIYTSGLASMTLLKAIEAGADIVDTAISPMAMGTSQPPTESLVATLAGTPYDTGISLESLDPITRYFTPLREKYLASGQLDPKMLKVDVNALIYQVPGGMLSNLVSQLKQAGKSDKLNEVLEEVPRVRADAGYPPLVTPSSQIVGTQAVFNVIGGERYKMVTKEFKGLVEGQYGKTPVDIDPAFAKKIIGDTPRITCRPADNLAPELDTLREKVKPYMEQEEDVLSYALFEQVALKFFEYRKAKKYGLDADHADAGLGIHNA